jgi:hypothetical protein
MNGNVGIGTWNPGSLLAVNGSVTFALAGGTSNLTVGSTATSSASTFIVQNNTNQVQITGDDINQVDATNLVLQNQGSNKIIIGPSVTYITNNNLGISTSLPSSTLSVGGGVSIGSAYTNGTSAPASSLIVAGNIGVGTWLPTSKITVGGTCVGVGPVGACWTATGQAGYCSGAAGVCTTCTAC